MADRGQLARRVRLISYGPPSLSTRPFLVLVPRIYPFPRGRANPLVSGRRVKGLRRRRRSEGPPLTRWPRAGRSEPRERLSAIPSCTPISGDDLPTVCGMARRAARGASPTQSAPLTPGPAPHSGPP